MNVELRRGRLAVKSVTVTGLFHAWATTEDEFGIFFTMERRGKSGRIFKPEYNNFDSKINGYQVALTDKIFNQATQVLT